MRRSHNARRSFQEPQACSDGDKGQYCCSKAQPDGSLPSASPVPAPRNRRTGSALLPAKSGKNTPSPCKDQIHSPQTAGGCPHARRCHSGRGRSCHTACATALPDFVRSILAQQFSTATLQPAAFPTSLAFCHSRRLPIIKFLKVLGRKKSGRKGKKREESFLICEGACTLPRNAERGVVPLK